MRHAIMTAFLGTALALSFAPRLSSACSCDGSDRLISPSQDSTDVPLNAVVLYISRTPPGLFDETHGFDVATTAEPLSADEAPLLRKVWLVRPQSPLAASSTF